MAGNIIASTLHAGIRLDNYGLLVIGNVFRANIVRAAATDGIAIDQDPVGPVLDTLLEGTVTIGASDDGIDVNNATMNRRSLVGIRLCRAGHRDGSPGCRGASAQLRWRYAASSSSTLGPVSGTIRRLRLFGIVTFNQGGPEGLLESV